MSCSGDFSASHFSVSCFGLFLFVLVNRCSTAAAHHNLASNRYTEPRPFSMNTTREISKHGFEFQFKMNMDDPSAPEKASFYTADRFYAPSHFKLVTKIGDAGAGHVIEIYVSPAAPGFCNMITRQVLVKTNDGKVQYTGRDTRDSQIKVCLIFFIFTFDTLKLTFNSFMLGPSSEGEIAGIFDAYRPE